MTVSIVIPVWNGIDHLKLLFDSLDRQSRPANEVIVVDNGSSDGAAEEAERRGARVVRFATNLGFAVAVNRGVAEATGELLAILNSDVELDSKWIEQLTMAISYPGRWFAAGIIHSTLTPGRIDGSWDLVSKAGMPWRAGHGFLTSSAEFLADRPIPMASFTAILLKRELWTQVGLLDSRFETYLEDADFGLRCVRAGYGGWYTSSARSKHQGSAALGRWNRESVRRMSRNQIFLVYKHFDGALRRRWGWKLFVGQALWGFVALRHGAGWPWLCGKWEGWRKRGEFVAEAGIATESVEQQEREILALQAANGSDRYWLWYARLTEAE